MGFCANCGNSVEQTISFCPNCFLDPNVPEEIMDNINREYSFSKQKRRNELEIEYPGESSSLALAILISIVVGIAFSLITFGLFLLFLIISLVYLKLRVAFIKASYVRCSKKAYANIFNISKLAAYRLNIPLYPVYIELNPKINAYTSGFWGDHWIILYSGLLNHLAVDEVLFVIGHEMGHIKKEHTTWLNLSSPTSNYALPIITDILRVIFNNWHLKSEYSADRAGLIATKKLSISTSALIKLIGEKDSIKIEEYLKEFENKSSDPLFKIGEYFQDHPYIPNRIKKLQEFAKNKKEMFGG
jgi:Zn-dependent protease with chaperone function